jgi:hypothetical protein
MFDPNGHRCGSNSIFKFPASDNQTALSPASSTNTCGKIPTKTSFGEFGIQLLSAAPTEQAPSPAQKT